METTRRTFMVVLAGISVSGCARESLFDEPDVSRSQYAARSRFRPFRRATLYRYRGMDYLIVNENHNLAVFRGPRGSRTLTRVRVTPDPIVRNGSLMARLYPLYEAGSIVGDIEVVRGDSSGGITGAEVVDISQARHRIPPPQPEAGQGGGESGGGGGDY